MLLWGNKHNSRTGAAVAAVAPVIQLFVTVDNLQLTEATEKKKKVDVASVQHKQRNNENEKD
jgi:hypothetical protein